MAAEASATENVLAYNTSSFEPTVAPSLSRAYIRPEGAVYPSFARSYVAPFHGFYERAFVAPAHGALSLGGVDDLSALNESGLAAGGHPVFPDRALAGTRTVGSYPGFDHGVYTGPALATAEASLPIRYVTPREDPTWYKAAITPKFGTAEYQRRQHVAPIQDMRYLSREEVDTFVDSQVDQPVFDQSFHGQYVPPGPHSFHKVRPAIAFVPPVPYNVKQNNCLQAKVDEAAGAVF